LRPLELPLPEEGALIKVLQQAHGITKEELDAHRAKLSLMDAAYARVFAFRMASLALQSRDCRYIEIGLWGLSVDDWQLDYRDIIITGHAMEDAGYRIGCDTSPYFAAAVARAHARQGHHLPIGGSMDHVNLESWLIHIVEVGPDGIALACPDAKKPMYMRFRDQQVDGKVAR
jgi:hypothetical protein